MGHTICVSFDLYIYISKIVSEVLATTTYYIDCDGVQHTNTTVMLPISLKRRAKEHKINVSEITRRALVEEIERRDLV